MGGEEDYPRKPHQHNPNRSKLVILLLVVLTNLLTIFIFTSPSLNLNLSQYTKHLPLWDTHTSLQELNITQAKLATARAQLSHLQHQLTSSNSLLESVLSELGHFHESVPQDVDNFNFVQLSKDMSDELKLAISPHKLPLGYSPRMGSDEVLPSVGAGCLSFQDELNQYMTYKVGGECSVDDVFAQ